MKITVTESMFVDAFDKCGRGNNFSREARVALFDWLSQVEEDCGEDWELDPIGICCEWSELSLDEVVSSYDLESVIVNELGCSEGLEDDIKMVVQDFLEEQTSLIDITSDGKYVFQQF